MVAVPVLLLAGWCFRHRWWWPAAPALAAGLLLAAHTLRQEASHCTTHLTSGRVELLVRTVDPGGGTGRATLPGTACTGEIQIRWPRQGDLAAGVVREVRGTWYPRPRPLREVDGVLVVQRYYPDPPDGSVDRPRLLDRFRTGLSQSSLRLYGERAALVDALVTGRRGEIDPSLITAFTASGLVHLLAISGAHIALIAAWVLLLLRVARVPRWWAEAGAVLAGLAYAAFLGWPPPAARAALLWALAAWSRWRQRRVRIGALFGLSAVILLIAFPRAITNVGAWLSVVALAGLTLASRWSDRALSPHPAVRAPMASLGATLVTAPITALVFGQVAPIAVVAGLLAGPIATLVQPLITFSLLIEPAAPHLAGALAASAGLLLELFEWVIRISARLPGSAVMGAAGLRAALPWLALLTVVVWAVRGQATARVAAWRLARAATLALWLLLIMRPGRPTWRPDELAVYLLDVGQGDATLLRTPGGHWVLIDAGPRSARWDAGERVILPFLRRMGVRQLDLLVVSHAHLDHLGGAPALLGNLPIRLILDPGEPFADSAYAAWLHQVDAAGVRWRIGTPGSTWTLDGVTFRVVHPPRTWPGRGRDLNEDSIVLDVRYHDFTALFTGDAGHPAEAKFLDALGPVDLLKVGHHGSAGSTSEDLLARTQPTVAVISVGAGNRYGHPAPTVLARLRAHGSTVLRTDQGGTISLRTDGHRMQIDHGRRTLQYSTTATPAGRH